MTSTTAILETISIEYSDIVIVGDFNSNLLNDDTILNSFSALGLSPSNTSTPTHFTNTSSTLLDSFFVNNTSKIIKYDQISAPQFSHHDCIFLSYFFESEHASNTRSYRDYRNLNYARLGIALDSIDWNCIFNLESADEQLDFLNDKIRYLFDLYVPLKMSRSNKPTNKSWFNNQIASMIRNSDMEMFSDSGNVNSV